MPQPHKRYDGYGRPLPTLADVKARSCYDHPVNVQARRTVTAQLEEQYQALLHRGTHAEVTLVIGIKDGVVMEYVRVTVAQSIPRDAEER